MNKVSSPNLHHALVDHLVLTAPTVKNTTPVRMAERVNALIIPKTYGTRGVAPQREKAKKVLKAARRAPIHERFWLIEASCLF